MILAAAAASDKRWWGPGNVKSSPTWELHWEAGGREVRGVQGGGGLFQINTGTKVYSKIQCSTIQHLLSPWGNSCTSTSLLKLLLKNTRSTCTSVHMNYCTFALLRPYWHKHTGTHTYIYILSPPNTPTHTHTHTHTDTYTLAPSLSHTNTLTHTHQHSHSFSLTQQKSDRRWNGASATCQSVFPLASSSWPLPQPEKHTTPFKPWVPYTISSQTNSTACFLVHIIRGAEFCWKNEHFNGR